MKANLTVKDRRFLEKYLDGRPLYECAKYAGSKAKDKPSLSQVGYMKLRSLDITMEETLSLCGVTDQILTEKIKEGLDANKKYFGTWQGQVVESKEFSDVPSRLKAVELAGRMKGLFIDRHELTGKDGGDIVLQITPAKGKKRGASIDL